MAVLGLFSGEKIKEKAMVVGEKIDKVVETIAPQPTKILASGLPDKHLIQAAFIPQAPEKNWEQPWQDACEEAALLTVDYFYRKKDPTTGEIREAVLAMVNFEEEQGWLKDVNLEQMAEIASKYLKYQSEIIDNPTVEQIKEYLVKDIPIVIPANGKTLYRENKHFKEGGPWYHNLVILGYDDTKQKFVVHDVGTQFGAYFKYSYDLLMESIHDFPESGDKKDIDSGRKAVLIFGDKESE